MNFGGLEIKMANTIMEAAESLGKLIGESEERKNAIKTADALRNDETAAKLMNDYNEQRNAEMTRLSAKEPTKEELENFQKLMQTEFNRIAENPIIAAYIEANKAYESLVKRVNGVLSYYINGEDAEEEGGCGGNCSACAGCH